MDSKHYNPQIANYNRTPAGACIECGQWAFSEEKGYNPTRFYSSAGMREFHISKLCEVCFDSLFADDEE